METRDYLSTLFDPGDMTCFSRWTDKTDEKDGGCLETKLRPAFSEYQPLSYLVINAMHTSRNMLNVTKHRSFLVEMDGGTLAEQKRRIEDSGMPWSTELYSGNKSLHFVISLEEPLPGLDEYRKVVNMLYDACLVSGIELDKNCKNVARFSRYPNVSHVNTGKVQRLLNVRGRVPNIELYRWIKSKGIALPVKHEYVAAVIPAGSTEKTPKDKFDWILKHCMQDDDINQGRHPFIGKVAINCNTYGMRQEDAEHLMMFFVGPHGNRSITSSEITKCVKDVYAMYERDHGTKFLESSESYANRMAQERIDKRKKS